MPLEVLCFYQKNCVGCDEQEPINREVEQKTGVKIEEINAVETPEVIKKYDLHLTPTIIVLLDNEIKEKFEGVIQSEELEEAVRRYL
jgi:thioredoxin 1